MPIYPQGKYWLLTIPHAHFTPYLPKACTFISGQLELGLGGGDILPVTSPQSGSNNVPVVSSISNTQRYLHWQLVAYFAKKVRLSFVRNVFGPWHAEPTKSARAFEYVHKVETRVEGTDFQLGCLPIKRGTKADWDSVRTSAKNGLLDSVPADIFVRCYNQLRRIESDFAVPIPLIREIFVYWGPTGSGKSKRAWAEAGLEAFPKDPRTKFWDGYRGHNHVVIDEYRGGIDISHILRWFDRYPVIVEVKGASVVLKATKIWITSNLHPCDWYPLLDEVTKCALYRRLTIVNIT